MTALLDVRLDIGARQLKVGRLAWRDRRALFEYAPEFLAAGLPLSPLRLPLKPGVQTAPRDPFAGMFGVFADSLPESYGRLMLDRRLRSVGRDPGALTPLDRLALVGEGGFGALRFVPADDMADDELSMPDLDRLQAEALAVIAGEPSDMLGALQRLGGSAGGARPKAQVWLGKDDASLATAHAPGLAPWLVKFRAPGDPEDIGALEAAYNAMASAAGIEVAPWRLLPSRTGPGHFASQRFDRDVDGPLHLHSLAGLLEADPDGASVSYREYLRATQYLTRDVREVEATFRRMAFNVIAHNRDDHARNHAFLMNADGEWRLAPAFDLTFSPGPSGEHYLAVGGEGRRPTRVHVLAEGESAGLPAKRLETILEEVAAAVDQWPKLAAAVGMTSARIAEIKAVID
ncbi:type II toxin-antitoxin system HipA family toxin (plasmid) [Polymorphobacter sp. PAMC 29334]|uniref:type II toxin-antitoxin system HipA family toxin n=1 Tax=Polymorphobacter sp. PAMC 29334 TaxID=2862331 RepID=UPI001C667E3D|nr:type II toxin-antitoxin system HipA family toxin [Polymorphobacter sp. PAMC 29334]QYE37236.1 type II toxin-antitoxin system HipA family toxin [Polymorphobacter sp. PAMC 29334]